MDQSTLRSALNLGPNSVRNGVEVDVRMDLVLRNTNVSVAQAGCELLEEVNDLGW